MIRISSTPCAAVRSSRMSPTVTVFSGCPGTWATMRSGCPGTWATMDARVRQSSHKVPRLRPPAARLNKVRLTRDPHLRRILVWRAFPRAGQVRPVVSASRRLQHSERQGRLAAGEAPPFPTYSLAFSIAESIFPSTSSTSAGRATASILSG
jgi:hypothetical protein